MNGQYEEAKVYLQRIYNNGDPISLPLQTIPESQSESRGSPAEPIAVQDEISPSASYSNTTANSSVPEVPKEHLESMNETPVLDESPAVDDEDLGLSDIEEEYIMVERYDSDHSYVVDSIPGKDEVEIEVVSLDDWIDSDYEENNVQIVSD